MLEGQPCSCWASLGAALTPVSQLALARHSRSQCVPAHRGLWSFSFILLPIAFSKSQFYLNKWEGMLTNSESAPKHTLNSFFPSLSACQRDNYLYYGSCPAQRLLLHVLIPGRIDEAVFVSFCVFISWVAYERRRVTRQFRVSIGPLDQVSTCRAVVLSPLKVGYKPLHGPVCLSANWSAVCTHPAFSSFLLFFSSLASEMKGDPCSGLGLLPSVPITSSSVCSVTYFFSFLTVLLLTCCCLVGFGTALPV